MEELNMKKILITGALVALLLTGCQQGTPQVEENQLETALENAMEKNPMAGVSLNGFSAKDLSGNTVDEDIFKQSKLTVLNLWGTFCSPCIDEMPDFQELSTEYDKKEVQVLGLVTDGYNLDEANKIVDKLGLTYQNIVADEKLEELIVNKFDYVPATLFVNQEGQVLDSFIPGGTTKDDLKEIIEDLNNTDTSKHSSENNLINSTNRANDQVSDDETYDDMAVLEEMLGMDIKKLSAEQIQVLKKEYEKIEAFDLKEDGSNEDAYYDLLDNFDFKMKEFGLKVPYYSYIEYANDHKDKISKINYKRLEQLNDQYMEMAKSTEMADIEAYDKIVNEIETIFKRSGLPAKEITAQVENRNVHYARFDVNKGKITYSKDNLIKEEALAIQQKKLYARLWTHIEKIVPSEYINLLSRFEVNTDGYGNVMAHVVEEKSDYSTWRLAIDLKDSVNADGSFSDEFTNTVIHEFAHVMTLHKGQLQGENIVDENAFSTQEGYLKTDSYLNKFYQRFWKDIAKEHEKAIDKDAETGSGDAIYEFYDKYENQFVSDYAATNPGEDIAETYRVFVMEDKPKGNSIRDQKIKFMYEFEELVKIRQDIRRALSLK